MRGVWTMAVAVAATGCVYVTDGAGSEAMINRLVDAPGARKLEARNVSGRLCITRGEEDVVLVRGRAIAHGVFDDDGQRQANDAAERLPIVVRDGLVLIDAEPTDDDSDDRFVTYDLEIAVPLGTEVDVNNVSGTTCVFGTGGRVEVESVSGDLTVDGAQDVVARTTSGLVLVNAVRSLNVETTSGDVEASWVLGDVDVVSVSGGVVGIGLGDDVRAETTSGNVMISGSVGVASTWELTTVSGDVDVRVATDDSFHLELDSASGDVRGELAPSHGDGSVSLRTTVGASPDAVVSVETVSGDVLLGHIKP